MNFQFIMTFRYHLNNSLLYVSFFSILSDTEKYDYVGKLLKPGEEPTDYSDEDDTEKKEN